MWKQILEYSSRLFNLSQKQDQHEEDIKLMRQDLKALSQRVDNLSDVVQQIVFELRRTQENAARDRQDAAKDQANLLLRLELALVKSGRELPPPPSEEKG